MDEYRDPLSLELLSAISVEDRLSDLPLELQVHIANAVGERCDRAALALASPRLLGLAACRGLQSYQGLEMSLAFHHVLGGAIYEQLLRSYASRAEATLEGCGWLTAVAAAAGSRTGSGSDPGPGPGSVREGGPRSRLHQGGCVWYLMQPDSTVGALLRFRKPHTTDHYEGAEGAERRVRSDSTSSGSVRYYEGEKGAERMVRFEQPYPGRGKNVHHYEGEKGAERVVRLERPGSEFGGGDVTHYEGEKGVERQVRCELGGGEVLHYEGEKRAERRVRHDLPSGDVFHYEGKKGAERLVRCKHKCGMSDYEGAKGTERLVRLGLQFGFSIHYSGERGTERPKSRLLAMVARALAAIFYFVLCLCQQVLLYTTHLALSQDSEW